LNLALDHRLLPPALVAVTGICVGLAAAKSITLALAVGVLAVGICALAVSPAYWALAAVAAAVIGPGLASAGLAPAFTAYLHFPICAAAFVVAVAKYRGGSRLANVALAACGFLALSCTLSTFFAGDAAARGLLSFALLGEPIALIAIIACADPSAKEFANLRKALLLIVLIQLPVAYIQIASVGLGALFQEGASYADKVTGTFGKLGGANTVSAIGVVGGIWLLALPRRPGRVTAAIALLALPLFARTYKVLLAIPAILVASPRAAGLRAPLRIGVVVLLIALLIFVPSLLPRYVTPSLEGSLSTESRKAQAFDVAWDNLNNGLGDFAFGAGPAETVSGAAFLTTDPLVKANSPIRYLHITPSHTAVELGALEHDNTSSFLQAQSSAFGLLGDLGVFGFAVYASFFVWLFLRLFGTATPEAVAASAGLLLLLILGFATDGWEIPSLTLFVGLLAALALLPVASRTADGDGGFLGFG
jgi:hypothetical protein